MHTIKTDADKARAIANVATALQERLILSEGRWTTGAQYSLLHLCNAVIDLIDDGDCVREREVLMDELRCDEGGNPLGPEADLVPFTLCKPLDQQIAEARTEMGEAKWSQLGQEWSNANA